MIKGIGVDIVEIERLIKALECHENLYFKLFTPAEREYCSQKVKPHRHYALRFAAKEAVLKALGIGFRGVKWTDIEISNDGLGKPLVNLRGKAAQKASDLDVGEILVSLSFSRDNAVASAIALGRNGFNEEAEHESSEL
jgi:holo-[acyl-carrier protein] synthase